MSTKIYNAFKVKDPDRMWPLVNKLFRKGRENVITTLREHYIRLVRHMDPSTKEYLEARSGAREGLSEQSFRLSHVRDKIRDRYRENVTRLDWDTYSLDVTIAFYQYRGEVYLRTFCEAGSIFRSVLDFVEKMPELEDFHYQNSTDDRAGASAKDWANRRRIWNAITKANDGVGIHTDLEICSWGAFHLIDPWIPLAKEWSQSPIELPSREEVWAEILRDNVRAFTKVTFCAGRITAQPGNVTISRVNEKCWVTIINGKRKVHKNLNRAADYVEFEHQSESTKQMVRTLMAQAKETRASRRKAKRESK